MNTSALLALLQAAAAVLAFAQSHAATASPTLTQSAINFGSNTVQIVTQAAAPIDFQVPPNDSVWPNIKDLSNAPYIDGPGQWTHLGATVQLLPEYTSFGDLNNDGMDDAAAIVDRPTASGAQNYFLAAMLNQGGIMFNIADFPLGSNLDIASHTISNDVAWLNSDRYELLGNTITQIP